MQKLTDVFIVTSTLFENISTIIYRAKMLETGADVILKTHKRPEDMHKIKHEFDLLRGRRIPGISNVVDIFNNNVDPVYLVSEDCGAVVLEDFLAAEPMDEDVFLTVAENAAEALAGIHAEKIVHRDIKPANMLVNPGTLEVYYIDFGISLPMKRGVELWQDSAAGTLEYIPPEQTGRINNSVDYRSDIYSLGVAYYQMVCGRLPFTGKTAMELIHAHIAMAPTPPGDLIIMEPIVSKGILKCLEKKPENRYQTAESLLYDIRRCRHLLEQGKDPNLFMIGEKDIFYNLEPGHKLYGKEEQLAKLKEVLDGISAPRAEIALLEGSNGTGKTVLLNRFEQYAATQNSLLLRGSFEEMPPSEPYYALRQAFSSFESQIYGAQVSLSSYREQILAKLGDNAQALVDILPQMESVLGKQKPLPKLSPLETQQRAGQVFRQFMQVINNVPVPCVIIFNSVQWADEATLRLLFSAFEGGSLPNCMLLLAYRDPEGEVGRRLDGYIKELNLRYNAITQVHLSPLGPKDVVGIVQDIFPQPQQSAEALGQLVFQYSDGSIHRMENYLKSLYHGGVIRYDHDAGHWTWDKDAIDPATIRNMDEQFLSVYRAWPPATVFCMDILCCFGLAATREQTEIIFGGSMDYAEVCDALQPPLDAGFITWDRRSGAFAFDNNHTRNTAYSAIPQDKRRSYHYTIGTRLYEAYEDRPDSLMQNCSLITDQYNRFGNEGAPQRERQRVISLNWLAGDAALQASNVDQALRYYETALSLLGEDSPKNNYRKEAGLYLNYASCQFAAGNIDKATSIYRRVIAGAPGEEERYTAYHALISQHLSIADWSGAERTALEYMEGSLLIPRGEDLSQLAREETERFVRRVEDTGIEVFLDMEECADDEVCRNGSILAILSETSLMNLNARSTFYLYKALNQALDNGGVYPDFEKVLALLAERNANMRQFERAKRIWDCGIAYAEKHEAPQSIFWAVYCTVLVQWVEPLAGIPAAYRRARHVATLEGNLHYGAFADLMLLCHSLFTGASLSQMSKDIDAAIYNVEKSQFRRFNLVYTSSYRQFVRCLTGRTKSLDSFDDRYFSETLTSAKTEPTRWRFNAPYFYSCRLMALYINGYYEKVLEYAEKMARYEPDDDGHSALLPLVQCYFYHSLALIRLCGQEKRKIEDCLPIIQKNQQRLKSFCAVQPDNFMPKYRMVEAGLRLLNGLDVPLVAEMSEIELASAETGCLWDRATLEELMAAYWTRKSIVQYSTVHRDNALGFYRKLGAKVKVLQMSGGAESPSAYQPHTALTYPTTVLGSSSASSLSQLSTEASTISPLDYQAILNVISCLVSEDSMEDLADQLLALLQRHGGADRALLFLLRDGRLHLQAQRILDRSGPSLLSHQLPMPLDELPNDLVPRKLVELSAAKQVQAVANSSDNEYTFLGDVYLEQNKPESFICLPVMAKGRLVGLVYLENARLPGVFPPQRASFLGTIVLQSALLLQNALDVDSLEHYTGDLEKRLGSYLGNINTLIAGIAHEINSPLGVCVTVTSRLLERAREVNEAFGKQALTKAQFQEYLDESGEGLGILDGNITRASDLVQNFKKIAVDQSNEVFEELDLMQVLRNIAEYVRPATKRKVESCEVTGPETLLCYTSGGALAQVFTNLLMNSAIHAFDGMEKSECRITIEVDADEDDVRITYTDNGRGMTETEREQVFLPFFTTRRKDGGSGLGGHIILTTVTQTLGGHVRCISAPDRGTSFIIKLPRMSIPQTERSPHAQ